MARRNDGYAYLLDYLSSLAGCLGLCRNMKCSADLASLIMCNVTIMSQSPVLPNKKTIGILRSLYFILFLLFCSLLGGQVLFNI